MGQTPIHLTILRKGDTHIVDLAEVGSLIPRSETQVDGSFLLDLTDEVMRLATPGYDRRDAGESATHPSLLLPSGVVQDLQRVGSLIFSHLLTEPARQRIRTADSSDLYLRLDEHLIHIPWELCYDGEHFLATKFRVGRQVITGAPIPEIAADREVRDHLKVLLVVDPTESLPEAGHEGELLCALLDGVAKVEVTLLGGKQVRKIPLLAALQTHDIVHFAGHSHYDPDDPSKSGWRLHEGVLTAGELSKLSRPPLLVFSNSCQAGTTSEWAGGYRYEGQAFGIGSAFLLAGVRNYVGTFWVVHDEESVLFATSFYQHIVSGLSLGEALLKARHRVLQQRGWQGLTWASYMLYGDPAYVLLPGMPPSLEDPSSEKSAPHTLGIDVLPRGEENTLAAEVRTLWSLNRLLLIAGVAFGILTPVYEVLRRHDVAFFPTLFVNSASERPALLPPHRPTTGSTPSLQPDSPPAAPTDQAKLFGQKEHQTKAVGVMHFKALNRDPQLEWMRDAIRDSFNSELSGIAELKVYSKEYIDFLVQKTGVTDIEVAAQLGIVKMISGSVLVAADTLRVEAHIVDVTSGVLEASDQVEGSSHDFVNVHRQLTRKIMARLNVSIPSPAPTETTEPPSSASLDTYKLLLEAEGETPVAPAALEHGPTPSPPPSTQNGPLSFLVPFLSGKWLAIDEAWAQESSPVTRPEDEIRLLLERYRQAYEQKDLTLLDAVYDALSPTQRDANSRYFQQTQNLQVTIRDVDIAITGDEAAVSYTREDQFVDAKTGRNAQLALRFTKFLVRIENAWKIASSKKEVLTPITK
jgi:TolB-like protein